jgi:hypothetical protein
MARDFNGSTDRIDYTNVSNPVGGSYTFSCWVWFDSVSAATIDYLFNINDGSGTRTFTIGRTNGGTARLFSQVIWSTSFMQKTSNDSVFSAAEWVHVLCAGNAASGDPANHSIYINGSLSTGVTTSTGSGTPNAATGTWSLGGRTSDDAVNLDGRMAHVGLWNRAADAWEIRQSPRVAMVSAAAPAAAVKPRSLLTLGVGC